MTNKKQVLKKLQEIPSVGKEISEDFYNIGIRKVEDFCGQNPEELCEKLCEYEGVKIDRCMLYVCRCVVYYAETPNPDKEKLKWWNHKY